MSLIGGLGSALSSFAGNYQQQKHDEDNRKQQQKQIQLAGLQALLNQNDLPMDVYTNAIDAVGALTGHQPTQQVADHLRQQMNQQVPLGPETQTMGSRVQQLIGKTTQAGDESQGLAPSPLPATETAPSMMRTGDVPRNVYSASQMLPIDIAKRSASIKPTTVKLPDGRWALQDANGNIVSILAGAPIAAAIKEAGIKAQIDAAKTRFDQSLFKMGVSADNAAMKDIKAGAFSRLYAQGINPHDPAVPQATIDGALKESAAGIQQREALKTQQLQTLEKLRQKSLNKPDAPPPAEMQLFRMLQGQKTKFDDLARKVTSAGSVGRSKLALAHSLQNEADQLAAAGDSKATSVAIQAQQAKAAGDALIDEEQRGKQELGSLAGAIDQAYPGYADVSYDDSGWPTVKLQALPADRSGIRPPPVGGARGSKSTKPSGGRPIYNIDPKYLNP